MRRGRVETGTMVGEKIPPYREKKKPQEEGGWWRRRIQVKPAPRTQRIFRAGDVNGRRERTSQIVDARKKAPMGE